MTRSRLILSGTVQGVGCRYYCSAVARRMGIAGVASNRRDGTVEVILECAEDRAAEYGEALRRNRYGVSFYGVITGISIMETDAPLEGDYRF